MQKNLLFFIFSLLLILGCNSKPKQNKTQVALARVGDQYLYEDDLSNLGLVDVSTEDSLKLINAYIDSWIRNETFIQYASKNLDPAQIRDIDQKVADYRESLLSYNYETQIVQNKLDTAVSIDEITEYYSTHQEDFVVNQPIYRYVGFKRDQSISNTNKISKWINDYLTGSNDAQLREYCTYNTIYCHLNIDEWVTQTEMMTQLGVENTEQFNFNSRTRTLFTEQTGKYYYLYEIIEQISSGYYPLDYVKNDIQQIIIREREKILIDQIRLEIFNKAMDKNEIEIYQ